MQQRYRWVSEIQTLPFTIAECEPLYDEALSDLEMTRAKQTQQKILTRLITLTYAIPELQTLLKSEVWQNKTPEAFSFELMGLMRFNSDDMQHILEMTHPNQRLDYILTMINRT